MQIIKKKLIGLLFLSVFLLPKTIFSATDPETFFHQVMGMKEKDFCNLLRSNQFSNANITIQKRADGSLEFSSPRGTFYCGLYQEMTLKELREKTNSMPMPGGGTFNVHKGNALDIAVYQADPNNNGAVFQVASNFNGLETTGPYQDIMKQLLEHYIGDRTQGPAAAMPAAPGLIWRRYFMFYDPNKPSSEWEQLMDWSSGRKVDFLSAITENQSDPGRPLMSQAGYFFIDTPKRMPTENDFENIRIAYHANLNVMFGAQGDIFSTSPKMIPQDQQNMIDQVFAAAVAWPNLNDEIQRQWAQRILQADYEGALRAAFLKGKKRVFLTFMGGGVFKNSFDDIFNAMHAQKDFIINSGLEVILVWRYSATPPWDSGFTQEQWKEIMQKLETELRNIFVSTTQGKFVDKIQGAKHSLLPISKNPPPVLPTPLTPKNQALTPLQTSLVALKNKLTELAQRLSTIGKGSNDNTLDAKITPFPSKATAASGSKIYLTVVVGNIAPQQFIDGSKAALVNAANNSMRGGGGIDGAIHAKATNELLQYEIKYNLTCPTGEARITPSFEIGNIAPGKTAQWIVHTVGPFVGKGNAIQPDHTKLLRSAYQNSLHVAWVNGLNYLTFCAISTAIFGYTIDKAIPAVLDSVFDFLNTHKPAITEIRFFHYHTPGPDEIISGKKPYDWYKENLDEYANGVVLKKLVNKSEAPEIFKTLEASSTDKVNYPPLVYEYTVP